MSPTTPKDITPSTGGFFSNMATYVKLVLRLMGDNRVNPLIKVLPIGTIIYWIAPDLLPVIPLDDAAVVLLGNYLFIELCPPEVVEEHIKKLRSVLGGNWRNEDMARKDRDDVIDGEYQEIK